jgi:4-hydroxythreonine-4-phosphate dehydrogenase
MGDPAGIGPEVLIKSLNQNDWPANTEFIVFGSHRLLTQEARALDLEMLGVQIQDVGPDADLGQLTWGESSPVAATIQLRAFQKAVDAVTSGTVDAIVTAPWTKHQFELIDREPIGHTDILADTFPKSNAVMMLAGPALRVALCTTHIPLADVSGRLDAGTIEQTTQTTVRGLRQRFAIQSPRIAVCGLNPHAGEQGSMGREELDFISSTVEKLNKQLPDAKVIGPRPADTLFAAYSENNWPYDAVICMYHDQGLIPLKMAHFGASANITLGLPIIRTSVDHGSAYDIAGKGIADPGSMNYAIETALEMVRHSSE